MTRERMPGYIDDMQAFCAIPSVPSDYQAMTSMALLVEERFRQAGLQVTTARVDDGHPVILASMAGASPRRLLYFNHYDVASPGSLDLWDSPPFELRVKDRKAFARGVADNKGNLLARLHAVESLLAEAGELPCSVVFLIDGKKSLCAPHLGRFVDLHREQLRADACLWENSAGSEDGRTVLRLGDKGLAMVRIRSTGTGVDLSSQFAPIFPSASWHLIWFLARVRHPSGQVGLKDFYKEIVPLSNEEKEIIHAIPLDISALEKLGQVSLEGDHQQIALKYFTDATANIASLSTGLMGLEMMSVNPKEAVAELDFRLVPDQTVEGVMKALEALAGQTLEGRISIECIASSEPHRTPVDSDFARYLSSVACEVYGQEPILEPLSPTVEARSVLAWSGMPIVGHGVGYSGSNVYAANEHIRLDDYEKGVEFIRSVMRNFGAVGGREG